MQKSLLVGAIIGFAVALVMLIFPFKGEKAKLKKLVFTTTATAFGIFNLLQYFGLLRFW
jgi:hypothetical protein